VRTGDKNKCLRDDGNLEVDDHVQLVIVVEDGMARLVGEMDSKSVLEKSSVENGGNQRDAEKNLEINSGTIKGIKFLRRCTQVDTVCNGVRENLGQIPTIRSHRGQHTVN
jgi:hypothetical protein